MTEMFVYARLESSTYFSSERTLKIGLHLAKSLSEFNTTLFRDNVHIIIDIIDDCFVYVLYSNWK